MSPPAGTASSKRVNPMISQKIRRESSVRARTQRSTVVVYRSIVYFIEHRYVRKLRKMNFVGHRQVCVVKVKGLQ